MSDITTASITLPARDGRSFAAYIATPATTPAPAIIMIQEIFGVNAEMQEKCNNLARNGFIAIAPDLFWRLEPGVALTDKTPAEWAKAFDLSKRFDIDAGIDDLRATHHAMRGYALGTGMVGCVGYCLGGKLAYLMAARSNIDAAVSYYGVGLEDRLDEAQGIHKPIMLHIAENDRFVPKDAQARIKSVLIDHPDVILHSYAGVNHAFSRINGEHYDASAAALANGRTLDFLNATLKKEKSA